MPDTTTNQPDLVKELFQEMQHRFKIEGDDTRPPTNLPTVSTLLNLQDLVKCRQSFMTKFDTAIQQTG